MNNRLINRTGINNNNKNNNKNNDNSNSNNNDNITIYENELKFENDKKYLSMRSEIIKVLGELEVLESKYKMLISNCNKKRNNISNIMNLIPSDMIDNLFKLSIENNDQLESEKRNQIQTLT